MSRQFDPVPDSFPSFLGTNQSAQNGNVEGLSELGDSFGRLAACEVRASGSGV